MASTVKDDKEDESQRTSPSASPPPGPSPENFRTVVTEIVQQAASELMQTLNLQMENYLETTLQKAFDDFQLDEEEKTDSTTSPPLQWSSPSSARVFDLSRHSEEMEPMTDKVSQSTSLSSCQGVSTQSSLNIAQEIYIPPTPLVLGAPSSDVQIPLQETESPGPSHSCGQDMFIRTSVCSIQDIHITGSATSTGVNHDSMGLTCDLSTITSVHSVQQMHLPGPALSPAAPYSVSHHGEDQDVNVQTQQQPQFLPLSSQDLLTQTPTNSSSPHDHPLAVYLDDIRSACADEPWRAEVLPPSRPVNVMQEEQVYLFQEQPTCPAIRLTPSSAGAQSPALGTLSPSSSISGDIMDTLLDKTKAPHQSTSPAFRLPTPSSVRSLSPALSVNTTPLSRLADSVEVLQEELPHSRPASILLEQSQKPHTSTSPACWLPTPSSLGSQSPASIVSAEMIDVLQEVTVNVNLAPQQSTSPASIFLTTSPGITLSPALSTSSLLDMAAVRRELQEDLVQRLPTPSAGRTVSPASSTVSPASSTVSPASSTISPLLFVSEDMAKVLEGDAVDTGTIQQQPPSPHHTHSTHSPRGTPATLSTISSASFSSVDIKVFQECSTKTYQDSEDSTSPLCRLPTSPIAGTHLSALTTDHSSTPQQSITPICRLPTPLPTGAPSPALSSNRSSSVAYVETNVSFESATITTLSPAPNSSDKTLISPPDTSTAYNVMVSLLQGQSQMYEVAELSSSPGWKYSTATSVVSVPDVIDPTLIFTSLPSEAYADDDEDFKSAGTEGQGQEELDYICPALDSYSSPIFKSSTRTSVSSRQDTLDPTMTFTSPRSDGEDDEDVIAGGEGKLWGNLTHSHQEPCYYTQPVWELPNPTSGSPRQDALESALIYTSDLSDTYVDDTMSGLQGEVAYCSRKKDSFLSHVWTLPTPALSRSRPDSLDPDFISTSVPTDTDEDDEEFFATGIMRELMEEAWVDSRSGPYDLSTPPAPSITPNFPPGTCVDENEDSTGYPASQEISTQTSVSSFKYLGYDESLEAACVVDYIADHLDCTSLQRDPLYLPAWNSSTLTSLYPTSCPQDDDVTKACVMMEFLEESWTGRDPSTGPSLYQPYANKLVNEVMKPSKISPPPLMKELEEMSLEDLVQQLKKHPGPSAQGVYTENYHAHNSAAAPLTDLKKSLSVVMKEFFDSLDERQMKEMSKGLHTIVVKDQLVNLCIEILQLSTQTIVSLSKSSEMFAALNRSVAEKAVEQKTPQNYSGRGTNLTFRASFGKALSNLVDKGAIRAPQEITDGIVNTVTDEVNTILSETVQVSLHTRQACSGAFPSCQMSTCGPCKTVLEEVSQEIQSLHKRPGVKKKRPWCLSRWCKRKGDQNCVRK